MQRSSLIYSLRGKLKGAVKCVTRWRWSSAPSWLSSPRGGGGIDCRRRWRMASVSVRCVQPFSISRVFCVMKAQRFFMVAWSAKSIIGFAVATGDRSGHLQTCLSSDPVVSREMCWTSLMRTKSGARRSVGLQRGRSRRRRRGNCDVCAERSQWIHLAGPGKPKRYCPTHECQGWPVRAGRRRTVCPVGSIRWPWRAIDSRQKGQRAVS